MPRKTTTKSGSFIALPVSDFEDNRVPCYNAKCGSALRDDGISIFHTDVAHPKSHPGGRLTNNVDLDAPR